MNLVSSDQYHKLTAGFRSGLSIRASAMFADVANNTALRYFNQQPPIVCPCGRALPHKGWCAHRVAMSPARQRFLSSVRNIKAETSAKWIRLKGEVISALGSGSWLVTVDSEAMADLRRFYRPQAAAFEFVGEEARFIAVTEATQDNISFSLFAALEKLHPAVRKFCLAIIDGASMHEAADEAGISRDELSTVLPPLKTFLSPYLFGVSGQ